VAPREQHQLDVAGCAEFVLDQGVVVGHGLGAQAQEPGNLSHRPSGDDQPEDLEFPGTEQLHRIFIAGELQDGDRVSDVRAQIELAGCDFFDGGGQNLGRIALGAIAARAQLHCALGEHGIIVHAEHQNAGIGFAADDALRHGHRPA
jgi:hypothetical protein